MERRPFLQTLGLSTAAMLADGVASREQGNAAASAGGSPKYLEWLAARHKNVWWAGVEPRVNETVPIHIGSDRENPTMITPCHWRVVQQYMDQQHRIRSQRENGAWVLHIERDGEYEFALRRWPVESGAAITAGMPAYRSVNPDRTRFPASEPLPIVEAELQIASAKQSKPVATGEPQIVFNVPLKRGRAELQTWFRDADGREICGAYYVFVLRR